jgi:hypothetical protein
MSMNQDSQDFEQLRRLLALKRYEQPPPGYFNDFSRQVIARIEAGDRAQEGVLDRLFWEAPWLQRLWAAIETKPVLAGAFGVAVCALLVGGVLYSENTAVQPIGGGAMAATPDATLFANVSSPDQPGFVRLPLAAFPDRSPLRETMASGQTAEGIFGLLPPPKAEATSLTLTPLTLSGGN